MSGVPGLRVVVYIIRSRGRVEDEEEMEVLVEGDEAVEVGALVFEVLALAFEEKLRKAELKRRRKRVLSVSGPLNSLSPGMEESEDCSSMEDLF